MSKKMQWKHMMIWRMGDNEFMGINKYNSIGTNGRDEK